MSLREDAIEAMAQGLHIAEQPKHPLHVKVCVEDATRALDALLTFLGEHTEEWNDETQDHWHDLSALETHQPGGLLGSAIAVLSVGVVVEETP